MPSTPGPFHQMPYRFPVNGMYPVPPNGMPIYPSGEMPSPGMMHPGFYPSPPAIESQETQR